MKAQDLIALAELVENYLPLTEKLIPLIQEVGKETKPLLENLSDAIVDLQIRAFNRYLDSGMSREEAMLFVIDSRIALEKITEGLKK